MHFLFNLFVQRGGVWCWDVGPAVEEEQSRRTSKVSLPCISALTPPVLMCLAAACDILAISLKATIFPKYKLLTTLVTRSTWILDFQPSPLEPQNLYNTQYFI